MATNGHAPARRETSTAAETKKTATPNDAVSLSHQGKAVSQLQKELASSPSYDSKKVAAIKEAIANGSYKVDPQKLADNMMKFENELHTKNEG